MKRLKRVREVIEAFFALAYFFVALVWVFVLILLYGDPHDEL